MAILKMFRQVLDIETDSGSQSIRLMSLRGLRRQERELLQPIRKELTRVNLEVKVFITSLIKEFRKDERKEEVFQALRDNYAEDDIDMEVAEIDPSHYVTAEFVELLLSRIDNEGISPLLLPYYDKIVKLFYEDTTSEQFKRQVIRTILRLRYCPPSDLPPEQMPYGLEQPEELDDLCDNLNAEMEDEIFTFYKIENAGLSWEDYQTELNSKKPNEEKKV